MINRLRRHKHRSTPRLEFRVTPTGKERNMRKLFNSWFDSFLNYIRISEGQRSFLIYKENPKKLKNQQSNYN